MASWEEEVTSAKYQTTWLSILLTVFFGLIAIVVMPVTSAIISIVLIFIATTIAAYTRSKETRWEPCEAD